MTISGGNCQSGIDRIYNSVKFWFLSVVYCHAVVCSGLCLFFSLMNTIRSLAWNWWQIMVAFAQNFPSPETKRWGENGARGGHNEYCPTGKKQPNRGSLLQTTWIKTNKTVASGSVSAQSQSLIIGTSAFHLSLSPPVFSDVFALTRLWKLTLFWSDMLNPYRKSHTFHMRLCEQYMITGDNIVNFNVMPWTQVMNIWGICDK